MIEVLVQYIQDKGFEVDVLLGRLLIRKKTHDDIISVCWAISKYDLRTDMEEYLYWVANRYMWQIDRAITERYGCAVQ